MNTKIVRKYFTQDMSYEEKTSYLEYINGDEKSTDWIPKALERREPLLLQELKCTYSSPLNGGECGKWVSIRENGICKCSREHDCYNVVIPAIERIMKNL